MHGALGLGRGVGADVSNDGPFLPPTDETANVPIFGEFIVKAAELHVSEEAPHP
jgi:hypothetical protein